MENNMNINWYPGHMAKTKRQITDDLKLVDIVIELLDARIPISSQNPDIANILQNKKRIIILNKSDLADANETNKWIQYFKDKNITALEVNSNEGKGTNQVIQVIEKMMSNELETQANKGRIRKTIRVMIVGIPNVGKSSFINRISKKTAMNVGNKPGVTKQKQWIRIGNQIELLDTPGVLWPKFENQKVGLNLAYTGSIKDEVIETLMDDVKKYEPHTALSGGEDGLYFYKKIIDDSNKILKDNGVLAFEIGHDQGKEVSDLMVEKGYKNIRVIKDLAGHDRVVIGEI